MMHSMCVPQRNRSGWGGVWQRNPHRYLSILFHFFSRCFVSCWRTFGMKQTRGHAVGVVLLHFISPLPFITELLNHRRRVSVQNTRQGHKLVTISPRLPYTLRVSLELSLLMDSPTHMLIFRFFFFSDTGPSLSSIICSI